MSRSLPSLSSPLGPAWSTNPDLEASLGWKHLCPVSAAGLGGLFRRAAAGAHLDCTCSSCTCRFSLCSVCSSSDRCSFRAWLWASSNWGESRAKSILGWAGPTYHPLRTSHSCHSFVGMSFSKSNSCLSFEAGIKAHLLQVNIPFALLLPCCPSLPNLPILQWPKLLIHPSPNLSL